MTQDEKLMLHALELSTKARVISPPNPWVGCLIVKDGNVIAEGHTQPPGQAHAEIVALKLAGEKAKGSTLFTTLEPCSHYGRTPPCTKAIIEAKISRAVIGIQDPDPLVRGKGIQHLREAGIEVVIGIAAEPIKQALAPYLYHRETGRPYCVAKTAVSIDGRIAAKDGTSQWISSSEARKLGHRIRAESQAIIIGSGTACADKPRLTVRDQEQMPFKPPLRVVLDATGRVPAEGPLFDTKEAPTLIITTDQCSDEMKSNWVKHHVEVAVVPRAANGIGVDLPSVMELLGKRDVLQVMIEGGGVVLGAFLEARLVNRFHLFVGPIVLGNEGIPLVRTGSITTLTEAFKLQLMDTQVLGDTVCINYASV